MRNEEVRPCAACGGALSSGIPGPFVGARIILQGLVVNPRAFQQHVGLETFFGGGTQGRVLADIMGLGSGAAIDESKVLRQEAIVCNTCSADLVTLFQRINKRAAELKETAAELGAAPSDA